MTKVHKQLDYLRGMTKEQIKKDSDERINKFVKKYISNILTGKDETELKNAHPLTHHKLDPKTSKQGKKKVCSRALHPEFHHPLIDVSELSTEKGYEEFNWLKSESKVTAMYLIEAAQRHLDKVKLGIDRNTEETKLDGTPCVNQPLHCSQVAYNMLMLAMLIEKGLLQDDRLFKEGKLK